MNVQHLQMNHLLFGERKYECWSEMAKRPFHGLQNFSAAADSGRASTDGYLVGTEETTFIARSLGIQKNNILGLLFF